SGLTPAHYLGSPLSCSRTPVDAPILRGASGLSGSSTMKGVVPWCHVFQVGSPVVFLVEINVIDLKALGPLSQKSSGHKPVELHETRLVVVGQFDLDIPTLVRTSPKYALDVWRVGGVDWTHP